MLNTQRKFRIVTRSSPLAMVQTHEVLNLIKDATGLSDNDFEIVPVKNAEGDVNLNDPLYLMGGTGVFTKQVEQYLLNKQADIAVHSLKDLPTVIDPRLHIAAYGKFQPRGDTVVLHSKHKVQNLQDLPQGSVIGTSSLRRIANLTHRYPHLKFQNIRGNMNTRLQKLDEQNEYDGIMLAKAGVVRLGLQHRISIELDEKEFLYAPAQGALGIQCRADDEQTIQLLTRINNEEAQKRCFAERLFLNKLEGGCKLPIAVYTELLEDNKIFLIGQVWSQDGQKTLREQLVGDYHTVGEQLSDIMRAKGAKNILN